MAFVVKSGGCRSLRNIKRVCKSVKMTTDIPLDSKREDKGRGRNHGDQGKKSSQLWAAIRLTARGKWHCGLSCPQRRRTATGR